MPKKTKTQPAPIRPELVEPLTEILRDRGLEIEHWPVDEAAAAIEEAFRPVVQQAFIDGVLAAQALTGFTEETFESILAKEGISVPEEPQPPARDERVALIWAQARNGVIGANGAIPWHLPEDFKHFREITAGQPVIMGRRTWDSLPETSRPLRGRTNIVVTSQDGWAADGAVRTSSLQDALEAAGAAAKPGDRIWIIGGGRLYEEAVHVAETAIITVLDLKVEGDTSAPALGRPWAAHRREPSEGWSVGADGTRYRIETWHPGL